MEDKKIDKNAKSKESDRLNSSLIYSLRILDYLAKKDSHASLAELSREVGINKSRIMRLCGTMEHMGYMIHMREEGIYSLGPRLLSLGKAYERSNTLIKTIRPELVKMANDLQETVSFQILRNDKRLCICSVESPQPVRYSMIEGSEGEFPYGASSKVLLTWGSETLRNAVLAKAPFKKYTKNTLTTETELRECLAQVRKQGYLVSLEDKSLGSAALAVPVFSGAGMLVGTICVSAVLGRMSEDFMERAIPYTLKKAEELSKLLGG